MAQNQTAYKFSLFDSYDYGTSAPQLEPVYEPEVRPQRKSAPVKKKKQSKSVSKAAVMATRASLVSSIRIVAVLAGIFAVFSMAMYLNGMLDETATEITRLESDIKIAQSENVRLSSALEGMVSIDKVEDYAENNLGMVKLENYKITYFDSDKGNHVVISGGKTYRDSGEDSEINAISEYNQ